MQADIVFIIDESTSIVVATYDNWYVSILGFIVSVINAFPIGPTLTRFGLVKFSEVAAIQFYFNNFTNSRDVINFVSSMLIDGGRTNMADGFRKALVIFQGARPGIKKLAILVTDGTANIDRENTFTQVNETKANNVEIFVVGITSQVDETELTAIASYPSSTHYRQVQQYNQLDQILLVLLAQFCQVLPTTPVPTTTTPTTTSKCAIFIVYTLLHGGTW